MSRRDGQIALLAIIVLAAAVRFAAAKHSLWFDEQAAVFFSEQPFSRLWSDWMLRETNPALYYSILRAWRLVAGASDLAVRAPSVIASLAALALIFVVTRRIYGRRAGLLAAALAALSGQQLYFAEQARAYIFVLCAVLVAVDALVVLQAPEAARARRRGALAAYAVAATAAIYLHTTMILFPPLAIVAVIAADPTRYRRRPGDVAPLVLASVLVLVAAAWEIRQAAIQLLRHGDNIAAIGLVGMRDVATESIQTLFLSGHGGKLAVVIAVLVAVPVAAFVVADRARRDTRFLAILGAVSLLAFAMLGRFVPVFVPRTIFWISVVPTILLAGALVRIPRPALRRGALALIAAALTLDLVRVVPTLEIEDWNTPVRLVAREPGAMLLVQGEAMALLADDVCRRRTAAPRCPYPIVAVTDRDDHYDTWARGLFSGPRIPAEALPRFAAGHPVFLFRKLAYHNLVVLLHRRGLGRRLPAPGPALIGPLPAAMLR